MPSSVDNEAYESSSQDHGNSHDVESRQLLILYATETGTAQETADRIARECRRVYFRCRVCNMATYSPEDLISETLVIFVVATTGSGAEPRAMTPLWSMLLRSDLPDDLFEDMDFCVFGLGDTAYERFCWPAKKLSRRLLGLGAREICSRGEGDDQHRLGLDGALDPWIEQLLDTLLHLYPLDSGLERLGSLEGPPRVTTTDVASEPDPVGPSEDNQNYFGVTVRCNRRITAEDWFQDVRHFELVSEREIEYNPGDVAVIHPVAMEADVESFLVMMGWANTADVPFSISHTMLGVYLSSSPVFKLRGDKLCIAIEKGLIKLPDSPATPVICVGPGTGIAPMRAVIEELLGTGSDGIILYFGCRSKLKDQHYCDEWEVYAQQGQVTYRVTFSRDGPEGARRIYVQDLLKQDKEKHCRADAGVRVYAGVVRELEYLVRGQWAGEKISARDKSVITDEFNELERDIELRKQGILKLQVASQAYHRVLSKKKASPMSGESVKLMPIDALGIVMVSHGEEFGEDSAFGTSLRKLGTAHCKIATLQEAYALTLNDTFLASCERFLQDIKDYEHQRKKLESRRTSYDTAINKLEKIKSSKKDREKERREAEDDLQRSRLQFEETSEDIRSRMHNIQENETLQLRELSTFLDIELNFAKQYVEVLEDVRANWCDDGSIPPKFEHLRTNSRSRISRPPEHHTPRSLRSIVDPSPVVLQDSDDDAISASPTRSKSNSDSRPLSRSTSRASRKRSDSDVTTSTPLESTPPKSNKRMSVTGWASSAVSSFAGRGKKDRDNFSALANEEEGDVDQGQRSLSHQTSSKSLSRRSPKPRGTDLPSESSPRVPARILKPPSRQERLVKAVHNFTGSSDELSFKAGDEITVINEVLEEWWLGMLKDGRKGLFPASYTTPVASTRTMPHSRDSRKNGLSYNDRDSNNTDDTGDDQSITYHMSERPSDVPHSATTFTFDVQSVASATEEDESRRLMPPQVADEDAFEVPPRTRQESPPLMRSKTSLEVPSVGKKIPPPPPPPRKYTSTLLPPLIPDRPSSKTRLQTDSPSSHSPVYLAPGSSTSSGSGMSPFDSLADLATQCVDFRQLPNELKGMCGNCFRLH
ncbi:hypothetical protein ID866_3990 [Astraeus odoratus]|nr:hypothetical protein ID866_3990 [Astraeus odoratus]